MRTGILIIAAGILAGAGFLLGWSLSGDEDPQPFGTRLHTLSRSPAEVTVPAFAPGDRLPPIETAVVETTVASEEGEPLEEPASTTAEVVVPQKEEKVEASPPSTPAPAPDVTVGESE